MPIEINPGLCVAYQLTAALQTALSDGEGIAKCLQWNGHASMRPCVGHCNVFKKGSGMVDEALGFVDITCSELARLREWTPAEFQRNVESVLEARRLWARREITKTTLGDVIKAAGFAPTDEGLLADPDLLMGGALLRRWNYDWMHCAFQAGFMSEAMWLVFKNIAILKFGSIGAGGDSMIGYLRQCQFPQCRRSVGRGLHHLFAPEMLKKHKSHGYIVANASVQFTLYAVVRDWATMEAEDDPQKDCEPDDGFSIVFQTESCEFVNLFRRRCCWGSSTRRRRPTSHPLTWS